MNWTLVSSWAASTMFLIPVVGNFSKSSGIFNICTLTHTVVPRRKLLCFPELPVPEELQEKLEKNFSCETFVPFVTPPRFLGHYFHVSMILAEKEFIPLNIFLAGRIIILYLFEAMSGDCSSVPHRGVVSKGTSWEKWYQVSEGCWWVIVSLYVVRNSHANWEIHQYSTFPCPVTTWLLEVPEKHICAQWALTWLLLGRKGKQNLHLSYGWLGPDLF